MNQIKKPTTVQELQAVVTGFGPRKEFQTGDVVVCVQTPYGHRSPVPGDRVVIIQKLDNLRSSNGGTLIAAGAVADYLGAELLEDHPQGYGTFGINSCFFVLESEYVEPVAAEPTTSAEEN